MGGGGGKELIGSKLRRRSGREFFCMTMEMCMYN